MVLEVPSTGYWFSSEIGLLVIVSLCKLFPWLPCRTCPVPGDIKHARSGVLNVFDLNMKVVCCFKVFTANNGPVSSLCTSRCCSSSAVEELHVQQSREDPVLHTRLRVGLLLLRQHLKGKKIKLGLCFFAAYWPCEQKLAAESWQHWTQNKPPLYCAQYFSWLRFCSFLSWTALIPATSTASLRKKLPILF